MEQSTKSHSVNEAKINHKNIINNKKLRIHYRDTAT